MFVVWHKVLLTHVYVCVGHFFLVGGGILRSVSTFANVEWKTAYEPFAGFVFGNGDSALDYFLEEIVLIGF